MAWDGSVFYIDNGSNCDLEFKYTDPDTDDEAFVVVPPGQSRVIPNYRFRGSVTAVVSGAGMMDVKLTKYLSVDDLMSFINAG